MRSALKSALTASASALSHESPLKFAPYASDDYRPKLRVCGARQSMSRRATAGLLDNPLAESLIATLRAELADHERNPAREDAMRSIDDIDNIERRYSHLDFLNPIEFEVRSRIQHLWLCTGSWGASLGHLRVCGFDTQVRLAHLSVRPSPSPPTTTSLPAPRTSWSRTPGLLHGSTSSASRYAKPR